MVVVKLMGGLGNQLFQYACGRALATKLNTHLVLDLDQLLDRTPKQNFVFRDFELIFFQLSPYLIFDKIVQKKYNHNSIFSRKKIKIVEEGFKYNSLVNEVKKSDVYLEGYWQSYKYFESIKFSLQKEFILKNNLSIEAHLLKERFNQFTTVAVHFRRGDYVMNPKANSVHGVCDMKYYLSAISYLSNIFENLLFVIFSDDISFVKNELGTSEKFEFIDTLSCHLEEFELMKVCNHFIISNSTFSWWAAWLSIQTDKTVVAPKRWFKDEKLESQTADLIPPDWIRL